MKDVLGALSGAGSNAERVRVMYVIGTGAQITEYVIDQKQQRGVNIVAVSNSTYPNGFSRDDAVDLRDHEILLFVGSGGTNGGTNQDVFWWDQGASPVFHATPRRGIQQPAVQSILPVTTDPVINGTDYGINSFYFAAPNVEAQSYAEPVAAVYAAAAAQEYQDGHDDEPPTAMQIKRAMMSGTTYLTRLEGRTITHDYAAGERKDGGLLDLGSIVSSINQESPEITGVSITQDGAPTGSLGTTVEFELDSTGDPSNWTISWGDNTGVDESGVEVVPGNETSREHTFPFFENAVHRYYPTIYAMSDTEQVYLQTSQIEVTITPPFLPTSGADHYILERDTSNGKTKLRLGTFSHSFAGGELQDLILTLGADDSLLIDFTNGNMLEHTALSVLGGASAGGVTVVGTSGADTLKRGSAASEDTFSVESSFNATFKVLPDIAMTLDGAGGNDVLSVEGGVAATLVGGSGSDVASVLGNRENETFSLLASQISVSDPYGSYTVPVASIESMSVNGGSDGNDLVVVPADLGLAVSVDGETGTDTVSMQGTSGNDTITIATSTITRGSTVVTTSNVESRKVYGGAGADTINASTSSAAVSLYGDDGNDTITGGSAADLLAGNANNDSLVGGAGNDTIFGDDGNDVIYGDAGADTIFGGNNNDWMEGGSGSDSMEGGAGDDYFSAQDGEIDTLLGGAGWDQAVCDLGVELEDAYAFIEEFLV